MKIFRTTPFVFLHPSDLLNCNFIDKHEYSKVYKKWQSFTIVMDVGSGDDGLVLVHSLEVVIKGLRKVARDRGLKERASEVPYNETTIQQLKSYLK